MHPQRPADGGGLVRTVARRPWLVVTLSVSLVRELRKAARDADLVHAHWLGSAAIARFARRPFVVTLHGTGSAGPLSDLSLAARAPWLVRFLLRPARAVLCVSSPLAETMRSIGVEHARLGPERRRRARRRGLRRARALRALRRTALTREGRRRARRGGRRAAARRGGRRAAAHARPGRARVRPARRAGAALRTRGRRRLPRRGRKACPSRCSRRWRADARSWPTRVGGIPQLDRERAHAACSCRRAIPRRSGRRSTRCSPTPSSGRRLGREARARVRALCSSGARHRRDARGLPAAALRSSGPRPIRRRSGALTAPEHEP